MKNRRSILGLVASLIAGLTARAQAPVRAGVREVARQPLTGPQEGMEAILVEVTAQPGVPSVAHRHPGFVLGYVLEGELKFAVNGKDPEIVKPGSSFFEPIGAVHTTGASAKPDAPVKFLAFIVAPKGSAVTLPA